MTKAQGAPSFGHLFMLGLLDAWHEALEVAELDGVPRFDTPSRYLPMVFMASEQLRRDLGWDAPLLPAAVEFLDWQAHWSLDFFRSPDLDAQRKWLWESGYIAFNWRSDTNFRLTEAGLDALRNAGWLMPAPAETRAIGHPEFSDRRVSGALEVTAGLVAHLTDDDFRDYLLGLSFKLRAEDRRPFHVIFDKRYDNVMFYKSVRSYGEIWAS